MNTTFSKAHVRKHLKKVVLVCFACWSMQYGYSQRAAPFVQTNAGAAGIVVRQEQGTYTNAHNRQPTGRFSITYVIDTLQHQLLRVSATSTDHRGEVIYLYAYIQNRLVKASAGVVQNGYALIQNTYAYDADDFAIEQKDLDAFSQTEEKYALLNESKKYLAVLTK